MSIFWLMMAMFAIGAAIALLSMIFDSKENNLYRFGYIGLVLIAIVWIWFLVWTLII